MALRQDQKIGELLLEGHALLGLGQASEAALAFGRVLLHDPSHAEAKRGLETARKGVVEAERILEAERAREADAVSSLLSLAPEVNPAPLPPVVSTARAGKARGGAPL